MKSGVHDTSTAPRDLTLGLQGPEPDYGLAGPVGSRPPCLRLSLSTVLENERPFNLLGLAGSLASPEPGRFVPPPSRLLHRTSPVPMDTQATPGFQSRPPSGLSAPICSPLLRNHHLGLLVTLLSGLPHQHIKWTRHGPTTLELPGLGPRAAGAGPRARGQCAQLATAHELPRAAVLSSTRCAPGQWALPSWEGLPCAPPIPCAFPPSAVTAHSAQAAVHSDRAVSGC